MLKVIDFGIAKKISNDTTNISRDASIGTISYMAPEAVKMGMKKLGRASDIWSLGIILYQMVYGHAPYAHLEPMQKLLRLNDAAASIDCPDGHRLEGHSATTKAQVFEVLKMCLQRDPRNRPSLPELLSHPFLQTSAEVQRADVEETVGAMMKEILQSAGLEPEAEAQTWQVLKDEAWERLTGVERLDGGKGLAGLEPLRQLIRSRAQREADPGSPAPQQQLKEDVPLQRPAPRPFGVSSLANIPQNSVAEMGKSSLADIIQKPASRSGLRQPSSLALAENGVPENVKALPSALRKPSATRFRN